ncbi:zincin [Rhizopogon vinicolor AM-OR11-026]|uniref:Zincin n=1 Tax=Rhizopogon vinicolor AM-OR11-026 TaxID=1314800 RepID=A0A1B7N209_9AGAM|nr:zincin [Rhizopogon vinicolor AM-OR11-026]
MAYEARPSTDQVAAPLLRGGDDDPQSAQSHSPGPSMSRRIANVVQEPLTGLTKVLLVEVLILLLISSVFIGLFAGAQHKLNLRNGAPGGGDGGGGGNATQTETRTATVTHTNTRTRTTTAAASTIISGIVTTTATATTTAVSTALSTVFDPTTTTKIATTTATKTSVYTSISTQTTTDVHTRTVIVGPEPTGPPSDPSPAPSDKCLTPDCIILAASILSSLDTSQDPCENFYDFANGGWIETHPIPGDKGAVNSFSVLSEQNAQVILKLLEDDSSIQDDSWDDQLLRKIHITYTSCMDETRLDYLGQEPLQKFVNTIRKFYRGKNYAYIMNPRQGLSDALGYLHSQGVDALFEFTIEGDAGADPNNMILWFSQPSLGLPSKEYYKDKNVITVYQDVIERLLSSLRDDEVLSQENAEIILQTEQLEDSEHVWPPWPWPPWDGDGDDDNEDGRERSPGDPFQNSRELAQKVVKFETEIAEATLDLDKLQQDPFGTYNPTSINTLKSQLSQINFPDYFATFTPRAFPNRVIITYKPYPSSLSEILKRTPADVIEAYLVVRASLEYAPNLGQTTEAWKAVRTLQETLYGFKPGVVGERSQFCMTKVDAALGFATGRYFVNQTFPGESRKKATDVIDNIIDAFESSLRRIEWMDEESARKAGEKAEALRVKVGFPLSPDTRDPRSLVSYYTRVKVHVDTFFDNVLSAASSDMYKMWQKVGKQRNLDEWEMTPATVNAYYNPPANEIVFPAGILQPPFFSQSWPGYLSYGSFGMVAAHELTHAFDSSGRLYNQQGKLEEWWSRQTSDAYQIRQDCIVEQYNSYTVDDGKGGLIHVNGNLTSGENIGDSGLIQAYRAWKAQYEDSYEAGKEYLLPGLSYTREQLFFISFARTWAMNNKPADAVRRVRSDPHSPNRYRTEGTVSNIPEFAEAFKCSKYAKLNPPKEKRCIFWS